MVAMRSKSLGTAGSQRNCITSQHYSSHVIVYGVKVLFNYILGSACQVSVASPHCVLMCWAMLLHIHSVVTLQCSDHRASDNQITRVVLVIRVMLVTIRPLSKDRNVVLDVSCDCTSANTSLLLCHDVSGEDTREIKLLLHD